MIPQGELYEFVFRGQLAEESLDRGGRRRLRHSSELENELANTLSLHLLDDERVTAARRMAVVYTALTAFENTARQLVASTMLEARGEKWWDECVSENVRKRAESRRKDDEKHRFHTQRGEQPINYSDLSDLLNIIRANEAVFEPFIPSSEWARSIFDAVERSRNVIMHSGTLDLEDIARVGINIRDWVTQVGA